MLSTDLAYLDQFTIVVYCGGFTEKDMLDVGSVCLAKKIPFLISQIYGFLGYCRLAAVEHTGNFFILLICMHRSDFY